MSVSAVQPIDPVSQAVHMTIQNSSANLDATEEIQVASGSFSYSWPQRQVGLIEQLLGPELAVLGVYQGYIYRYKQAILNDKVCLPGESYIEFVCTMKGREGRGARSKLVAWASKCAESLGCGTIRLSVMGETPSAKDRFERDGFVVSKSWTDPIAILIMRVVFGINEDCYFEMEKPLGVASGIALHSDAWGYQNDRVALSDSGSSHHSFHDDLSSSLHDIAHNFLQNTRGLIHSARDFVYGGAESLPGANDPEYGHKYSSVLSPILSTCISDSTHHEWVDESSRAKNLSVKPVTSEVDTCPISIPKSEIEEVLPVAVLNDDNCFDDKVVIV